MNKEDKWGPKEGKGSKRGERELKRERGAKEGKRSKRRKGKQKKGRVHAKNIYSFPDVFYERKCAMPVNVDALM